MVERAFRGESRGQTQTQEQVSTKRKAALTRNKYITIKNRESLFHLRRGGRKENIISLLSRSQRRVTEISFAPNAVATVRRGVISKPPKKNLR